MSPAGVPAVIVNLDHEQCDGPSVEAGAAAKPLGSRFPRMRRLLSPAEFSSVLSGPVAVRAGAFSLHVAERPSSSELPAIAAELAPAWRLGLVIPKRFEASAARRNAIKRRWREAFRLRAASLEAQLPASDLVVRMSARLSATKRPAGKQAASTAAKRRQVQQGGAIPAIDAALMIDRMVARLRSKALASRPPR